ncbi:hypothetical protein [Paraburkholderia sp. MM5482-R1]|uniref:hypothetical protein n=1 Tax=unclassified Paraburkholderia TaxID=2615204 RepID=UPI003D1AD383
MTTAKGSIELYKTDEDFWMDLERLNALENPYTPWRSLVGRKSHIDEFGDVIAEGELHYVKEVGGSVSPPLRLSRSSIERVLYVAVCLNPRVQRLADKLLKEARDELLRKLDGPESETELDADLNDS